jgi:hypothetical protein
VRIGAEVFVVTLLVGCGLARSQDDLDRDEVRRLCGLPAEARVSSWHGYPAQMGFGQREGLYLHGEFELPARAWAAWFGSVPPADYQALPLSASARAAALSVLTRRHTLQFVLPELAGLGFVRCRTAGNNVLYARQTRACDAVAAPDDIILCVANRFTRRVSARVRSMY